MLQAQSSRELHMCQADHKFTQEISKIVPLGAPYPGVRKFNCLPPSLAGTPLFQVLSFLG
jgi:hypothetical protein